MLHIQNLIDYYKQITLSDQPGASSGHTGDIQKCLNIIQGKLHVHRWSQIDSEINVSQTRPDIQKLIHY